jgi:DNA-binding MarR family transcriptional regulator
MIPDDPFIYRLLHALETAAKAHKLLPALPAGLKPMQFRALLALDGVRSERGVCRISDIGEKLDMRLPNATKLINELVETGLLEKIPSREDRRVVLVAPTERGETYIQGFVLGYHRALQAALAEITEQDCAAAIELIDKLYCALQRVYREFGQPEGK